MFKPALALAALALAGCGGDTCPNPHARDLRVLEELIAETEADIDRGYTYGPATAARGAVNLCVGSGRSNVGVSFCTDGTGIRNSTPVAIDLASERRKLAGLKERRDDLTGRAATRMAACQAARP